MYYSVDKNDNSLRKHKGNPFLNYEDKNTNYAMLMEEIVGMTTTMTKTTLSQIRSDYMDYLMMKQRKMERGLGEFEMTREYGDDVFDDYNTSRL